MNIIPTGMNQRLSEIVLNRIAAEHFWIASKAGFWRWIGFGLIAFGIGTAIGIGFYGYSFIIQSTDKINILASTFAKALSEAQLRATAEGTVQIERTLPALEAAHIKPFAEGGSHDPQNGLLLRRDIHALFDGGYVTVTQDLKFHVSRRIKEEFENGQHYYALEGQPIATPAAPTWNPDPIALKWHSEECFRG